MGLYGIVDCTCKAAARRQWKWDPDDPFSLCDHEFGWQASFSTRYGHVALFQDLVTALLEGGTRGAKHPFLMRLSADEDFRQNYSSDEAAHLRRETESIWNSLSNLEIPGISVEIGGEVFVSPLRIGASGDALPVYEGAEWELIVQRDGQLLFRDTTTGDETHGRRFEWQGSAYVSDDGQRVEIAQELGSKWLATATDATYYSELMKGLVSLCEASIATGNDIVFS